MKARYVEAAGMRASLRAYWDAYVFDPARKIYVGKNSCPDGYGRGKPGIHNAQALLIEQHSLPRDESLGGRVEDHPAEAWPSSCEHCKAPVPDVPPAREFGDRQKDGWVLEHQVFRQTLYATPDRSWFGLPLAGDMFFADWYECEGHCVHGWTNCDGHHLIVMLPNMSWWDTNGRASNCNMKNDTLHRCWVRHGDPAKGELVHVDKAGTTCGAGAGSIAVTGWHGFLHNGDLHEGCTYACRR